MNISARDNISLGVSNFFVDIKALSLNPHSLEKSEKLFSTAFKPDEEYSILRSPELMTNSYNIECYLESGIAAKECGKDGSVSEENLLDIMAERCEKLKDLMSRVYSGEELENILGKIETGYYNATKKTFDTVFSQIAQPFYQKCVSNEITGEENIFEDMSAKYEKLRTAICEKYSGDDREKFLAALDSSYDNVSERDIAGGINYIVNEQTMRTKLRIVWNKMAKNIKHGIFNELRSSLSAYDNYDSRTYNQNSIKWLESIKNSVINLAKKSREYIALGNHAPSNDLEKISFDNFISNSGDSESEYLSYSDIKSLTSVCVNISNNGNKKDNELESVYNSVNNSDLNSEMKDMLNSFLAFYVNNNSVSTLNDKETDDLDELDNLLAKRVSKNKTSENATDEEKYQNYIKAAKINQFIDKRLMDMLGNKEIINKVLS